MKALSLLALFLCLPAAPGLLQAAEPKPVYTWMSANEYYLVAPLPQKLELADGGGTETVRPWGFGLRAVGNGPFAKTAGLQLQGVKVDSPATGRNTFYLLDLLLGLQYFSPERAGRPLRFTAAGLADFGLSGGTLYAAPVFTAGLLYTTSENALTPTGLTFELFFRPMEIDLDDAGRGRAAALRPALGLKLGYIFEGFWAVKENK